MSPRSRKRWIRIPDHDAYEVSTDGEVRRWLTGQRLRLTVRASGHLKVSLGKETRTKSVHRLVLESFVGPCPEGMECRHLNGDPSDNRLSNLRWGTHRENMLDSVRHGTRATGSRNGNSRLHEDAVREIRSAYATGKITQRALALQHGVSQKTIFNIVKEKQWQST